MGLNPNEVSPPPNPTLRRFSLSQHQVFPNPEMTALPGSVTGVPELFSELVFDITRHCLHWELGYMKSVMKITATEDKEPWSLQSLLVV